MRLLIDSRIFNDFPDVRIGALVVQDLDNTGDGADIRPLLDAAQRQAAETLAGAEIVKHPHIAPWRDAYRRFGAKPKKYRSSIENMARRVIKGGNLPSIHPLVDVYNVVSLRHLLSVGGEDIDRLEGDLRLTYAGDAEPPALLLGEKEPRSPHPGEILYRDDAGAVCRRWNWKEADRTKLAPETRRAVLVIETLPPVGEAELSAALTDLAELVERFCGGRSVMARLHAGLPSCPLD